MKLNNWTVDGQYLEIVKCKAIKGLSFIPLLQELRHHMKGLINMKNDVNECFRWCHIRYLNPQEKCPQGIKWVDKAFVNQSDYSGIEFTVNVKQYDKIEKQNDVIINVFSYENKQPYPIYVSKEKFENQMNLLLITEDESKHCISIKDFNRFMFNQTKHKEKKHFCMFCLQVFSKESILKKHKAECIVINGKQAVRMPDKGGIIMFQNYHRQLPVPFEIYVLFFKLL